MSHGMVIMAVGLTMKGIQINIRSNVINKSCINIKTKI